MLQILSLILLFIYLLSVLRKPGWTAGSCILRHSLSYILQDLHPLHPYDDVALIAQSQKMIPKMYKINISC